MTSEILPTSETNVPRRRRTLIAARRGLGQGIIYREFRMALTAIVVLALLDVLILLLQEMEPRLTGGIVGGARSVSQCRPLWLGTGILVALSLGTLCGAEEEERGTTDFARRLPVTRGRVLVEKLLGAGLAFACWNALALGGLWLCLGWFYPWPTAADWREFFMHGDLPAVGMLDGLAFSSGLVVALLTRRNLVGLIGGALLGGGLLAGGTWLLLLQWRMAMAWVPLCSTPALLMTAVVVFIRREGK